MTEETRNAFLGGCLLGAYAVTLVGLVTLNPFLFLGGVFTVTLIVAIA